MNAYSNHKIYLSIFSTLNHVIILVTSTGFACLSSSSVMAFDKKIVSWKGARWFLLSISVFLVTSQLWREKTLCFMYALELYTRWKRHNQEINFPSSWVVQSYFSVYFPFFFFFLIHSVAVLNFSASQIIIQI